MTGMLFEDFRVGMVLRHDVRRTITETDNVLFNALTMNPQPLHLDEHFSAGTMFGTRIVNSVFTLGLVVGISVAETTLGTTLGNLGFSEISFPAPVRHGDTLHVETEVLDKRPSGSRPGTGIVQFEHRGLNQDDVLVCRARRAALMRMRTSSIG